MHRAASLLRSVLRKRGLFDEAQASHVLFLAQRFLAELLPAMAGVLHARRIEDGVLLIDADHSIAMQEGQATGEELLRRLREALHPCPVRSLRFRRSAEGTGKPENGQERLAPRQPLP